MDGQNLDSGVTFRWHPAAMVDASRLHVQELVVAQDFGQFYVINEVDPAIEDQLELAYANDGIGQEAWIEVTGDGLIYGSPTLTYHPLDLPPGHYRIRIAGTGFVQWGWPGTTTPGDTWRFQLWLSDGLVPAHKLRTWPGWNPGPSASQ